MNQKHDYSETHSIYKALSALQKQQAELEGSPPSCFSTLKMKLYKVDTIPFMLLNENGPLEISSWEVNPITRKKVKFTTSYFRIEQLQSPTSAKLSLLIPYDLFGHVTGNIYDLYNLRKTRNCLDVDLTCFCAVQCLELDLLRRETIVEPKW